MCSFKAAAQSSGEWSEELASNTKIRSVPAPVKLPFCHFPPIAFRANLPSALDLTSHGLERSTFPEGGSPTPDDQYRRPFSRMTYLRSIRPPHML
mmetsp:Transcript_9038/g.10229  ORF Transcript_9038/g.10229 Transcript_9038/m.10229 type:complete len:95 (-) Transcript_9038:48-332(-)